MIAGILLRAAFGIFLGLVFVLAVVSLVPIVT
jgi:hypothetical protein